MICAASTALLPAARSRRRGVWRRCHPRRAPVASMSVRRLDAATCSDAGADSSGSASSSSSSSPPTSPSSTRFSIPRTPPPSGTASACRSSARTTRASSATSTSPSWADEHALASAPTRGIPLRRPSSPAAFARFVEEGFQFTSTRHQGVYADASWSYEVTPLLGWGGDGDRQYSAAGWLAAVPVFDPHYQVLMAHGRASGHVCWRGERYDFDDAIVYSEKNWGDKFPSRWFWMECNTGWSDPGVITRDGGGRAARGARRRRGGRRDDRSAHGSRPGRRDGQIPAVPQRRVADGPMGPVARQWRVRRARSPRHPPA